MELCIENGVCRCCLSVGSNKSLGNTYFYEENEEIYSVLLRDTFNINISVATLVCTSHCNNIGDTYRICDKCIERLREARQFKLQVLRCEQMIAEHYCNVLHKGTGVGIKLEDQVKQESLTNVIEVDLDLASVKQESSSEEEYLNTLKGALKVETINKDNEIPKLIQNRGNNKVARKINNRRLKEKSNNDDELKFGEESICDICNKKLENIDALKRHKRIHNIKLFTCRICNSKHVELTAHIEAKHCNGGKYPCALCTAVFDKAVLLKTHLTTHSKSKNKECPVCGKVIHKCSMSRHMNVHKGIKKHQCETCQKSFAERKSLNAHKLIHTGEKQFVCEVCGMRFMQAVNLNRHVVTVHERSKWFSCKMCHKRFTTNYSLKTHIRDHTGEMPYSCEVCKKPFKTHKNFETHKKTHLKLKPFACSLCSKRFAQREQLKVHARTHTGERPFCCNICGKYYYSKSTLCTHKKLHLSQKPFACDMCKLRFGEKRLLAKHIAMNNCFNNVICEICNKQVRDLNKHMKMHADDYPFKCVPCCKVFPDSTHYKLHMRNRHPEEILHL